MNIQPTHSTPQPEFSGDLLRGADRIAEFLFGDANERRKVYHLAESSRLRAGTARRKTVSAQVTRSGASDALPKVARKSHARCAWAAAVKMARLSDFSTASHGAM